MRLLKRTYAMPADILEPFEQQVAAGKRSAVITELLREWLDQQRREQLRREVIEGCRDMAEVYLEVEREFHPLEEEVQRALDAKPEARRHRAGAPRSRRGI
jgi:hypothetical protein